MAQSPETKKCVLKSGDYMFSQDENEHFKRYDVKCKDSSAIVTKIQYVVTGVWSKGKYEVEE